MSSMRGFTDYGLSADLYDKGGALITTSGPLVDILPGAAINIREMDGWTDHTITFFGGSRDALLLWARPHTELWLTDSLMGTVICKGVIENPEKDLDDNGTTLKVVLKNLTNQLTYNETGRGRIYKTTLQAIVSDLVGIQPGWTGNEIDTGANVLTSGAVDWLTYGLMVANGSSVAKGSKGALNWDAGAVGYEYVAGGDGALAFVVSQATLFGLVGFTHNGGSIAPTNVDRGIFFQPGGVFQLWQGGIYGSNLPYAAGDAFTITLANGQTTYARNGVPFQTTTDAITYSQIPIALGYSPGFSVQNAIVSYFAPPSQQLYAVRFEQATPQYAVLGFAKDIDKHARQGRASDGTPLKVIEVGDFGTPRDFWLTSGDGVDSDSIRSNPSARVILKMTKKKETSSIVNHGLPLGAGQGNAQVQLDLLWRILYDPTFTYYGKYGNRANSVWPEYDPTYPMYALTYTPTTPGPGVIPIPPARVQVPAKLKPDGSGLMYAATNDGRFDYYIGNTSSVAAWGVLTGNLTDNTYSYTTSDVPTQIMVQRALYAASVGKLKRQGTENWVYTIVTDGYGLLPNEGDTIHVQHRDVVADDLGPFSPWDEDFTGGIVKVVRSYADPTTDTWTITTSGDPPQTAATVAADQQRQIQALRLVPDIQTFAIPLGGSVQHMDDTHPVIIPFITPDDIFRVTSVSLYVDPQNPRSPVMASGAVAENSGTGIITTQTSSSPNGTLATGNVQSSSANGPTTTATNTSASPNGPTKSFGVVSASTFGPSATFGVSGSPTPGGISGPNVTRTYSQTAEDLGTTTTAKTGLTVGKTNLAHRHALQVGSSASSSDPSALHFISQSGTNSFLEVKGGTGGQLWTNTWIPAGATNNPDPDHNHGFDVPALGISQQHYISDTHSITHYHDISHYHDMSHYHDISHWHDISHFHYFPHTHALLGGIFEIAAQGAIFTVYVDGTDVTGQATDNGGSIGPWTNAFSIPDLMVSPYAAQRLNTKGKHTIEIHCTGSTPGQHGFTAIQTAGMARVQVGALGVTAYTI